MRLHHVQWVLLREKKIYQSASSSAVAIDNQSHLVVRLPFFVLRSRIYRSGPNAFQVSIVLQSTRCTSEAALRKVTHRAR